MYFISRDLIKKVLIMYANEVIACNGVYGVVSCVKTFHFVVELQVDWTFGKDCLFEVRCG